MKPVLLAFGNCQSAAMATIAQKLPSVTDSYEVHYLASSPDLGSPTVAADLPGRCAVVWEQVGVSQKLPFRDVLSAQARTVRFPELSFPLLWPLDAQDPRNKAEPPLHWGRYPYGERLALQLMTEGLFGTPGYDAWVERGAAAMPDLNRLFDLEMMRSRRRAADVDFEPMNHIMARWRTERLFATLNHPSNTILWSVFVRLAAASGLVVPEAELEHGREWFLNPSRAAGDVDMDWFQNVIHPHVAEAFGLAWCTEDLLHRCEVPGNDRKLTRREFMTDYYMAPVST